MLMVGVDEVAVESDLLGGRLVCPNCDGELRPWWFARARKLRNGDGDLRIRPRRAMCQGCRTTHVLLPVVGLLRRRDLAEVIGQALVALAEGLGHRTIAGSLDIPPTTVRGWLRRFGERAEQVREHFTRLAFWLDPSLGPISPRASPSADAVEAIALAARGAAQHFGPAPVWWVRLRGHRGAPPQQHELTLPAALVIVKACARPRAMRRKRWTTAVGETSPCSATH